MRGKGRQSRSPLSTAETRRASVRRLRATLFPHRVPAHFDSVRVVHQSVEDAVGQCDFVPTPVLVLSGFCCQPRYVASAAQNHPSQGARRDSGNIILTETPAISSGPGFAAIRPRGGIPREIDGREARGHGGLLRPQRDLGVAIGRVEADMSEPRPDDIDLNACLK